MKTPKLTEFGMTRIIHKMPKSPTNSTASTACHGTLVTFPNTGLTQGNGSIPYHEGKFVVSFIHKMICWITPKEKRHWNESVSVTLWYLIKWIDKNYLAALANVGGVTRCTTEKSAGSIGSITSSVLPSEWREITSFAAMVSREFEWGRKFRKL
jgi:hypothetical protein